MYIYLFLLDCSRIPLVEYIYFIQKIVYFYDFW